MRRIEAFNGTFASALLSAVIAICMIGAVHGADYPTRPIKLVVPTVAGGSVDTYARIFSEKLAEKLGQPIVIDYRPGANGLIGMTAVAQAKPDGYTMLANVSSFNVGPLLQSSFTLDGINDLAPVILLIVNRSFVVANAKAPFSTLQELASYGKANPGKLNVASAATTTTMDSMAIAERLGIDFNMINYAGTSQLVRAIVSGEVDLTITSLPAVKGFIDAGTARALAVVAGERFPLTPDVPAIRELLPDYVVVSPGIGILAPKNTPRDIVDKWNSALNDILKDPAIRQRIYSLGAVPGGGTPEDWYKHQNEEFQFYKKAAQRLNIKPQ